MDPTWGCEPLVCMIRLVADSRRAAAVEDLGRGSPVRPRVGAPLPRIWGPGQSPAGAQRRTKAANDPAPHRDVQLSRRRTKAIQNPAPKRDVQLSRTNATKYPAR